MALGLGISKAEIQLRELNRTSSLNKCVICDLCGKKERSKEDIQAHLLMCVKNRTCSWCNIVFKNRGNLFSHISHLHGKKVGEQKNLDRVVARHTCTVCKSAYSQKTNLRYHNRRQHYNMIARINEIEKRQVNEIWFERVLNSDTVVQITKAKLNMYLIKKVPARDTLVISEPKDSIDLSPLYPTQMRKHRIWCDLCEKTYYQRDFNKHIREKHEDVRQHECNNCNKKFKRPYQYLQHKCKRRLRWGGRNVKKFVDNITID